MDNNDDFDLGPGIISRLSAQVADLVVQLAIKDSMIERLQARLQVQGSPDSAPTEG
jgi:hypothetical protein